MEFFVAYAIPISVAVIGGGLLLFCWWYICLRQRWQEKGILPFNYDGFEHRNDPEFKNLFQLMAAERRYDRQNKKGKIDGKKEHT